MVNIRESLGVVSIKEFNDAYKAYEKGIKENIPLVCIRAGIKTMSIMILSLRKHKDPKQIELCEKKYKKSIQHLMNIEKMENKLGYGIEDCETRKQLELESAYSHERI